jgi:hypothetical protein
VPLAWVESDGPCSCAAGHGQASKGSRCAGSHEVGRGRIRHVFIRHYDRRHDELRPRAGHDRRPHQPYVQTACTLRFSDLGHFHEEIDMACKLLIGL